MTVIKKISLGYYSENNTRFVFIDGLACPYLEQCYSTLQTQLSLPSNFGKNLDALDEMLADLDWITESKVKIILLHEKDLFSKEPGRKGDLLEMLQSVENKRLELVFLD